MSNLVRGKNGGEKEIDLCRLHRSEYTLAHTRPYQGVCFLFSPLTE
jgi:hypothetical protein